jgi:Ca-activated chloride channel family protein
MRKLLILTVIAVLFLLNPTGNALGQTHMVMILDGSGSMWGQIEGIAKITIAKEVMNELIDDLPGDLNVGLTAYGHRREGDCRDVEQLTLPGPVDKAGLKALVNGISPKGKTPIAFSLTETAGNLKAFEGERVIVLVTDGIESCDGDPCRVARELAEAGVVTRIHIVGFDLTEAAMTQLGCIAAPSGGLVVGASNAGELKEALGEVVKATAGHNLVVHVKDGAGKPLYAKVRILADGSEVAAQSNETPRFSLPSGSYTIEATHIDTRQSITLPDIQVPEDRVVEKDVVFADGTVRIEAVNDAGENLYVSATAYRPGSEETAHESSATDPVLTLPQGIYDIAIYHTDTYSTIWLRGIEVGTGATIEKEVLFSFGEVLVHVRDAGGNELYSSVTAYTQGETENEVYGVSSADARLILLPGAYDIEVYSMDLYETKWLRGVTVTAGGTVEETVQF